MKILLWLSLSLFTLPAFSQQRSDVSARQWVDSVFATLTPDQKIGQLIVVRMSSTDGKKVYFHDDRVREAIDRFHIGGICLFQGGPLRQASLINEMQARSKTPILISIDAEYGLGMRMDSVTSLPRQMMMGAVEDASILYEYGKAVGDQCKRMGIQINYAPVADINNNPLNPVINDRSFGENKFRVAMQALQYMRGMQDAGVMACAKHFPGHGDVSVDSHYDLPVVNKSRKQLDSLELYPFRQLVKGGIGSVMVAHLAIPSIEKGKNVPTSLSRNTITKLLRNELDFEGLIITDALEMKGVTKFFPAGEVSLRALLAGNDMLCLPEDLPATVAKIKEAIDDNKLEWEDIDRRVKRILRAKYDYGLSQLKPVSLVNLTEDLNSRTESVRKMIAERALTLLRNEDRSVFPLAKGRKIAYLGVGLEEDNVFARELRNEYNAHTYYFDYKMDAAAIDPLLAVLKNRYEVVVLGVHRYNRYPANKFGISSPALELIKKAQEQLRTVTFVFGNPYAISNFCDSRVLIACYQDDAVTHQTAVDLLNGRMKAEGKLPVSVCEQFPEGTGLVKESLLPEARAADMGFNPVMLTGIDSVVQDAIRQRAIPGAVVLVAKEGRIVYERAFGYTGYDSTELVYPETIYDLASVTKILATTISVMKLYEQGKISLSGKLGDYLPWTRGTNKEHLTIWNLLLHQGGLVGWIPFYKETVDSMNAGRPLYSLYSNLPDSTFRVRVAENLFMRRDWTDSMYNRILNSQVGPEGKYIYSDLDFIFLGNVVESVTGMTLDQYARETFYDPLGLQYTTFRPREKFPVDYIAPTETEQLFRRQTIRGDVHDPGAAMFGGIAGHAGLFSNVEDMAVLCQMLLNGGTIRDTRFLKKETVDYFTRYHTSNSRRGLGFDKPERDNHQRAEPYPTRSASPATFGHTGFTGTCIWIDPRDQLVYIFLSNRVYSNGDPGKFLRMNVRPNVHEILYESLRSRL